MITDEEILKVLGRNIRRLRKAKELSQLQVEVAAGLPAANLTRIERGQKDIHVTKLIKIAEALGVQLSNLYFIPPAEKS